jgi:hypothetical protein
MTPSETSKTITVLTLALLIAYLIFGVKWLLWLAVALCAGNALESRITTAIARYWMRFATIIGGVNSRIILFVMFFLILTPIAFFYRLFNREQVDHFRQNRRPTCFDDVRKSYGPDDFEKLW